jgi:peptidoglycan/xylan/chitin deacetylase (PgdA/CDA1 family)
MSPLSATTKNDVGNRRPTLNFVAGTLWYVPGSFGMARLLGPRYSLRCVLFHDISDIESSFTRGLGVTVTRRDFAAALKFITRHYTPVSLEDVIADSDGCGLPPRPVLLTFDDAYVSVREFAAPLCAKFGIPAVFFVNGVCLDNRQMALENLVCYVTNVFGLDTINAAIRSVNGTGDLEVRSLIEVFSRFLPRTSLPGRHAFRNALVELGQIDERSLAAEAGLYLSSQQLRDLAAFKFEIGNHTYSHPNCRSLSAGDFASEIDRNRAVLEAMSGTKVRSFSVPYGSSADLTVDLVAHLKRSGYEAVFLAEGRANSSRTHGRHLDRVSVRAGTDACFFSEIEILPRLRTVRKSLFGASNVEHGWRISDRENLRQPAWPCTSKECVGIGSEVPRKNPET